MATRGKHQGLTAFVAFFAALTALAACTNNKRPRQIIQQAELPNPPPVSKPVIAETAYIQLDGGVTEIHKISFDANGVALVTGKPHALMALSGDFENPDLLFVAKDYLIDANQTDNWLSFSHAARFGPYLPDLYGRNALVVHNGKALMSGTHGMSVVPLGNYSRPVERFRVPIWVNNNAQSDARYQYTAMLSLPNTNTVVGFRRNDGFFYLNAATNSVTVTSNTPVPYHASFCCVNSATIPWGGNTAYVANQRGLLEYRVNGSAISFVREITSVRAFNVASTQRYLYIHHVPQASDPAGLPRGILVVKPDGKLLTVLPLDPRTFAVTPDDRFVLANLDDRGLSAVRVLTENIPGWGL